MTEKSNENNKDLQPQSPQKPAGDELDAAGKSLSEALRISFVILKIIMIVLVVFFLASGFKTVGSNEKALVLRFGKIRGLTEKERLLGPGLHWVFPYPIDEMVKIPVAEKPKLTIDTFWYPETPLQGPTDTIRIDPTLNPIRDGYCLTRSAEQSQTVAGSTGSDYNIVHSKWQLNYEIDDAERFFKNVYIQNPKPGQSHADIIEKSIAPLLQGLLEDAVVTAMVNYTIDEVLASRETIPRSVERLLQKKLDKIQSGIEVVSVDLTNTTWPRQVNEAFLARIKASQQKEKAISEAQSYAENTFNEAAGPIALELLAALQDKNVSEEEKELLWSELAGQAQEKIAQARAHRAKVVGAAEADAEYLKTVLPEYRKRPELFIQKVYLDAIEYVLNNADEKIIVQPTHGSKAREIRIYINRDPTIKPKSKKGR